METVRKGFITSDLVKSSLIGALKKFNPVTMIKNPVMFVVEIGFIFVLLLSFFPNLLGGEEGEHAQLYNAIVAIILFVTILFANFAESIAEGRGKAQVQTLKNTKTVTKARVLLADGTEVMKQAHELKKGDIVLVQAGSDSK